jgi:hypothetical protein
MAKATESIVNIWRGLRATYDEMVRNNGVSYWTHYYVKETNGTWSEYFGKTPIKQAAGQLYPVDTVVEALPSSVVAGQRFLVGQDATASKVAEYYVVEISLNPTESTIYPLGDLSIRVKDRGLMSYQIVDGKLTTYDEDIFCGTF